MVLILVWTTFFLLFVNLIFFGSLFGMNAIYCDLIILLVIHELVIHLIDAICCSTRIKSTYKVDHVVSRRNYNAAKQTKG